MTSVCCNVHSPTPLSPPCCVTLYIQLEAAADEDDAEPEYLGRSKRSRKPVARFSVPTGSGPRGTGRIPPTAGPLKRYLARSKAPLPPPADPMDLRSACDSLTALDMFADTLSQADVLFHGIAQPLRLVSVPSLQGVREGSFAPRVPGGVRTSGCRWVRGCAPQSTALRTFLLERRDYHWGKHWNAHRAPPGPAKAPSCKFLTADRSDICAKPQPTGGGGAGPDP